MNKDIKTYNDTFPDKGNIPRNRKFSFAVLIFILFIALLGVIGFILTASAKFLIAAVICILTGSIGNISDKKNPRLRKRDIIGRPIALMIILFFIFCTPPITLSSALIWQYPFQKFYTGLYHNVKDPEWFPDFRDEIQSDYSFNYIPSIMQGTGHYSICFVTSPEIAAEYESKFASGARYIIPRDDFTARSGWYTIGEDKDGSGNNVLDVYCNMNFWKSGEEPNAQIYVLDAVLNFNHPHSSAVIIDRESGRIQLSQYG